jgi:hypothetical protein
MARGQERKQQSFAGAGGGADLFGRADSATVPF